MVSSPSGRRGSSLLGRAHHQGGWGRLSDDRPGQHNPDSSEDPWGGGLPTLHGGASARNRPDTERDIRGYDGMHEGRKQTNTWSAYAGSRLELSAALGRRRPKRHPSSRTGENPPYGMIGGIEETSASFEARSAPRSYPTPWVGGCRLPILAAVMLPDWIALPEFGRHRTNHYLAWGWPMADSRASSDDIEASAPFVSPEWSAT